MPKKTKNPKITKRPAPFFARRAPDLPFWVFLTLGALALATFACWLKPSGSLALSPSKGPSALTRNSQPATAQPSVTVSIENASDPSLVAHDNKLYLTFRNNVGGYSVAVYDQDLKQLEAPRWITNGFAIPNQQVAAPLFVDENWYLAYLGGDGYTRLAKFDANWNPQRNITFATVLAITTVPPHIALIPPITPTSNLAVILYNGRWYLFCSTLDLGINCKEDWPKEQALAKPVTLGNKTYQAETVGTSVTIKMN